MRSKFNGWQKVLYILFQENGSVVDKKTLFEKANKLDKKIHMYRMSSYIHDSKGTVGAVIKSIRDGKKVTAYQLMNVDHVKKYFDGLGITPKTEKLSDISDQQSVSEVESTEQDQSTEKLAA